MKLYKQIAFVALAILAGYIAMVWLASTYTTNAQYYIEQHCELVLNKNGNNVTDNYYICDDWHK